MTVLDLSYNFANLSVHDLLEARDTYHYHLLSKANVVGTAIGHAGKLGGPRLFVALHPRVRPHLGGRVRIQRRRSLQSGANRAQDALYVGRPRRAGVRRPGT